MNKQFLNNIDKILYSISAFSFILLICYIFGIFDFSYIQKSLIYFFTAFFSFFGSYTACLRQRKAERKYSIMKKTVIFLFVLYAAILIDFTLIDDSLGRNIRFIFSNPDQLKEYLDTNVNLLPFATIELFIKGYRLYNLSFSAVITNLLGNFLAFMPLAFFFPAFCKKLKNWYAFLGAVVLSVAAIEVLQLLLLTGSFDIDDLILNSAGALTAFGIIRIKAVSEKLSAVTFGVWKNGK